MPGKTNLAADAASLYLSLINEVNSHDSDLTDESLLIADLVKHSEIALKRLVSLPPWVASMS